MKHKIKHVWANHDEYVHVHRLASADFWVKVGVKAVLCLGGGLFALWLLSKLLPWLIQGAMCWGALQVLGKK